MKFFLGFCTIMFIYNSCYAQTYIESSGTQTVSLLKSHYTKQEIFNMLRNNEMLRNSSNDKKFGISLTDNTSKKLLICNEEISPLLFELIKMLENDIIILKSRLNTAGIP